MSIVFGKKRSIHFDVAKLDVYLFFFFLGKFEKQDQTCGIRGFDPDR